MPESSGQTLPLTPSWLSKYIEKWIAKKNQAEKNYTTRRQNIYILPSRTGIFFVVVLLIILIGAINYNNSLAYLLCFFLSSLGFVDMLTTHQNLKNIQISYYKSDPAYCGQQVRHHLIATSTDNKPHTAMHAFFSGGESVFYLSPADNRQYFDVWEPANKRGLQSITQFKLYTEYPLGLFHAWSQIRLDASAVIYPRPVESPYTDSTGLTTDSITDIKKAVAGDDFSGIREFRKSDSPKAMAWKKIAQTGMLYSKNFESEMADTLVFRLSDITHTNNLEEKLSILCQKILEADKSSLAYGLELDGQTIEINSGQDHKHACLRLLALYQQ